MKSTSVLHECSILPGFNFLNALEIKTKTAKVFDICFMFTKSFVFLQACSKVVKFIYGIHKNIRESLDGKNIDVVLTELGTRLHRVLFEHLQQFQYNSLGTYKKKSRATFMCLDQKIHVSCV